MQSFQKHTQNANNWQRFKSDSIMKSIQKCHTKKQTKPSNFSLIGKTRLTNFRVAEVEGTISFKPNRYIYKCKYIYELMCFIGGSSTSKLF